MLKRKLQADHKKEKKREKVTETRSKVTVYDIFYLIL